MPLQLLGKGIGPWIDYAMRLIVRKEGYSNWMSGSSSITGILSPPMIVPPREQREKPH